MNTIINLHRFAAVNMNVNTTATGGLSDEMKTYYHDTLIDLMEPELVHDFGATKVMIPSRSGKSIEFRKWDSLPELTAPIEEGVTPDGQALAMSTVIANVEQYGGYVTISDVLQTTAIDDNIQEATELIASQAGRTLDTITRNVINAGTMVRYAGGKTARLQLHYTSADDNDNLKAMDIKRVARDLKNNSAPKLNGSYWSIIHPYVSFDLTNDPEWKWPHQYKDTTEIYDGEIGKLYGVRFIESPRAMVFKKGGASSVDVYSTLVFGAKAYDTTSIKGLGVEHIVKQKGSAGTADPLDQRATVGWKATKVAKILVEQYIYRIESTATPA